MNYSLKNTKKGFQCQVEIERYVPLLNHTCFLKVNSFTLTFFHCKVYDTFFVPERDTYYSDNLNLNCYLVHV